MSVFADVLTVFGVPVSPALVGVGISTWTVSAGPSTIVCNISIITASNCTHYVLRTHLNA